MEACKNPATLADGAKIGTIGKIQLYRCKGSIRLRWSVEWKDYSLNVRGLTKDSLKAAIAKAQLITSDIAFERFDKTLVKYNPLRHVKSRNPKLAKKTTEPKQRTLQGFWENYKEANANITSVTTQMENWRQCDRCLNRVSPKFLEVDHIENFIAELLKSYSVGTLERVLADLKAACNLAIRQGHLNKNPFVGVKLPKRVKSRPECFTNEEIKIIITAFYSDEFTSKYAGCKPSWYGRYIEFLALTFCRPEEAIALTRDDIKIYPDGSMFISFNKAHSRGTLKATKTNESRLFKCNEQLKKFIASIPFIQNDNNLLFPSAKGGYIDQRGFGRDVWKPLVTKLVELGRVQKYLKCYCLRHSGITRVVRAGHDVATVARLAGNSPEMIIKNYLAAKESVNLPEL